MHSPPIFDYCGLCIITNPSRFDLGVKKLISGQAEDYVNSCLHPFSLDNCHIFDKVDWKGAFPLNTKAVLILGEEALELFGLDKKHGKLDTIRGYPLLIAKDLYCIASFHHQDSLDRMNWESAFNSGEEGDSSNPLTEEIKTSEGDSEVKNKTKTKRNNYRWWLFNDIKRVCQIVKNQGAIPKEPEWIVDISPDAESFLEAIRDLKDEEIILDIETTRNFTMTCFGLGILRSRRCFVIPWKRYNSTFQYSFEESCQIIKWLLICLAKNKVILHNASFDLFILALKYKVLIPKDVFDTMIAWHRLRPEIEKSLGHLISYYTWYSYHKDEGIFEPKSSDQDYQLWNYNSKDIIRTGVIYERIQADIKKYKAEESVALGNREVPSYLTLSLTGAKMDLAKRQTRIQNFYKKQEAIDRCLNVICRKEINPRSPKQLDDYFYKRLAFKCPDERSKTGEATLLKLKLKHNIPSISLVLASRQARTKASGLDFLAFKDDRMTCSWVLAGPDTYRLGSRAILKRKGIKKSGYGRNFQNYNKDDREIIVSDPGKILIQTDQSGAEALIVAYLCQRGKFRLLFELGIKCHSFVALHLFKDQLCIKKPTFALAIKELVKLPIDKLVNHPAWKELAVILKESDDWSAKERYYFIAKMVVHSSNYDIKWPTFQSHVLEKSEGEIVLSAGESKHFLQFYRFLFPEIPRWHLETQDELKANGRILRNLFGHPRYFNDYWGDSLFKKCYAFKPQSTVGQITNYGVVKLQENNYWGSGYDILQNGHDSILSQCSENEYEKWGLLQKNALEPELISPRGEKFRMKSEISIGKNWAPYKEGKNPDGMREIKL